VVAELAFEQQCHLQQDTRAVSRLAFSVSYKAPQKKITLTFLYLFPLGSHASGGFQKRPYDNFGLVST